MNIMLLMRFFRTQHWAFHILITAFIAYPRMDFLMALIIPIIFCQQAFLFASNDYFDRDIDAQDPKKIDRNVLSCGLMTLTQARVTLAVLVIVPVILSALIGWIPFVVNAIWLIIAYYYTAPPFRFKKRIGLDLLVHGITVFSFPFLFTMVLTATYTERNILIGIIFVSISVFSQVLQENRDYETDILQERNSVIAMGLKNSLLVMLMLLVIAGTLTFFLVLTKQITLFFSLGTAMCLCWIYDIIRTWRNGELTRVSLVCFHDFIRKSGLCFIPIFLAWLFI